MFYCCGNQINKANIGQDRRLQGKMTVDCTDGLEAWILCCTFALTVGSCQDNMFVLEVAVEWGT